MPPVGAGHGDGDETREVRNRRLPRLDGGHAELLGDQLGVDEVDRTGGAALQGAAEHAQREQAGVEVGHAAAVGDLERVHRLGGQLDHEPSQARAQVHVRHELVGVVADGDGHVDGAAQQAAAERGRHLLGRRDGRAAAGVGRAGLGRAREQQPRRGEHGRRERRAGLDGHRGAGQTAGGERGGERLEVHGARRTRADQPRAGLELRQLGGAEELHARRRLRHQHVRLREHLLRRDALDDAGGDLSGRLRLAGEHLHAQRASALDEERGARAHADEPERLAPHLDAVAGHAAGLAAAQRGVGAGQVAGDGQHERQRVLGLGDERAVRRVDHEDAAPRGLGHVDGAGVLAGAAHHAQLVRAREHAGRDRRPRRDEERVVPVQRDLAGRAGLRALLDLQTLVPEPRDTLGREAAEHQHLASRGHLSPPGVVACVAGGSPRDRLVHHALGASTFGVASRRPRQG